MVLMAIVPDKQEDLSSRKKKKQGSWHLSKQIQH